MKLAAYNAYSIPVLNPEDAATLLGNTETLVSRAQKIHQARGQNPPPPIPTRYRLPPEILGHGTAGDQLRSAASEISEDWFNRLERFSLASIPPSSDMQAIAMQPTHWRPGWNRWDFVTGATSYPDWPEESEVVMDCETYVRAGGGPVMASAVSEKAVYLWLHEALLTGNPRYRETLIPLKPGTFVVNHNVAFDLARTTLATDPESLAFCTMAAHAVVAGLSNQQRATWKSWKGGKANYATRWASQGAPNSLVEAASLHVPGLRLTSEDKKLRNLFVNEELPEFVNHRDPLIRYCLRDSFITYALFRFLWPKWKLANPHPASLAAHVLELRLLVPLRPDFKDWRVATDYRYREAHLEVEQILTELARDLESRFTSGQLSEAEIAADPFYSQLDWSVAKSGPNRGRPLWYRKTILTGAAKKRTHPVTLKSQITPLLLRLFWRGFPVYRSPRYGWVYRGEGHSQLLLCRDLGMEVRRLPHPKGPKNVGSPLAKHFVPEFGNLLTSDHPRVGDMLRVAKETAYWGIARGRILGLFLQDHADWGVPSLKPTLSPTGTLTGRAIESTFLTAPGPDKGKLGSEIKALIQAPPGYRLVGADFASQELVIGALFSDAQITLEPGATEGSRAVLLGDKDQGTDGHTLMASRCGISRKDAKSLNFALSYLAGKTTLATTLQANRVDLSYEECQAIAGEALEYRRGHRIYRNHGNRRITRYEGGIDSPMFNFMLDLSSNTLPFHLAHLAHEGLPRSPLLGSAQPLPISELVCGDEFTTSRANWAIQKTGADLRSAMLVLLEHYKRRLGLRYTLVLTIHDEIWFLAPEEEAEQVAYLMNCAHAIAYAALYQAMGFTTLPVALLNFPEVNIDLVLRKEVTDPIETPSFRLPDLPEGTGYRAPFVEVA